MRSDVDLLFYLLRQMEVETYCKNVIVSDRREKRMKKKTLGNSVLTCVICLSISLQLFIIG